MGQINYQDNESVNTDTVEQRRHAEDSDNDDESSSDDEQIQEIKPLIK